MTRLYHPSSRSEIFVKNLIFAENLFTLICYFWPWHPCCFLPREVRSSEVNMRLDHIVYKTETIKKPYYA